MVSKGCDVCGGRLRSAKLCNRHLIAWTDSKECKESTRTHDLVSCYARWLREQKAELPASWRHI